MSVTSARARAAGVALTHAAEGSILADAVGLDVLLTDTTRFASFCPQLHVPWL